MARHHLLRFEHHSQPLLPRSQFITRLGVHVAAGSLLILLSLGIGILGYHYLEDLAWVDALLNASMILGGMGPVAVLTTTGGKIFASIYALFSGVLFLAAAGLMVAPVIHRLFHRLHLDDEK